MTLEDRYKTYRAILSMADRQATQGKGHTQHMQINDDWENQISQEIEKWGIGYARGQAVKKILESKYFEDEGKPDQEIEECLGAINYLCTRINAVLTRMD